MLKLGVYCARTLFVCVQFLALLATMQSLPAPALPGSGPEGDPGRRSGTPEPRAEANAPNGYAPGPVSCPTRRPAVRTATALSPEERSWLQRRQNHTVDALLGVIDRAKIAGFDAKSYFDKITNEGGRVPKLGIAVSGGGYRALMNGAGALAALDGRTANSTSRGQLGGFLQAATYLSGLSGGSWVVGSLYVQNFTTVESIIYAGSGWLATLWQFADSIIQGPASLRLGEYYRLLQQDIDAKVGSGYNKTITDYWGRALSFQLVNSSDGGPAYTFSSIANDVEFREARTPMPIIVAVERPSGQLLIPENSTVFEFNPWEMGSFDRSLSAFAPLQYVGSKFDNGVLPASEGCVAGVDNAGFVMGTSSSLFNQAFLQIHKASNVPDFLLRSVNETLGQIGQENRDVASWPNPFYRFSAASNPNSNSAVLALVDGGETLQNIPLHPLVLPLRQVDVILAIDSSADTTTSWPNGTALVATYKRSVVTRSSSANDGSIFPSVPDQNTFVNLGLNKRPTFFGCYMEGNGSVTASSPPLIVYLPNAPYTYFSNVSTFDLEYANQERDDMIRNGYNVMTMGNATLDQDWPACVSCAALSRSFSRTGTQPPRVCVDCFGRYCWNGTLNSTTPIEYAPTQIITIEASVAERAVASAATAPLLVVAAIYTIFLCLT